MGRGKNAIRAGKNLPIPHNTTTTAVATTTTTTFSQTRNVLLILLILTLHSPPSTSLHVDGNDASHLIYPPWTTHCNANSSVRIDLKTTSTFPTNSTILLFYKDDIANGRIDYVEIYYNSTGYLVANVRDDKRRRATHGPVLLNDGKWHSVGLKVDNSRINLIFDGAMTQLFEFSPFHASKVKESRTVIKDFNGIYKQCLIDDDSGYDQDNNVFYSGPYHHYRYNNRDRYLNYYGYSYIAGLPPLLRRCPQLLSTPSALEHLSFRGYLRNVIFQNCTCSMTITHYDVTFDNNNADVIRYVTADKTGQDNYGRSTLRRTLYNTTEMQATLIVIELEKKLKEKKFPQNQISKSAQSDNNYHTSSKMKDRINKFFSKDAIKNEALLLVENENYVIIQGLDLPNECFGNLALCGKGYTLSFWLNIVKDCGGGSRCEGDSSQQQNRTLSDMEIITSSLLNNYNDNNENSNNNNSYFNNYYNNNYKVDNDDSFYSIQDDEQTPAIDPSAENHQKFKIIWKPKKEVLTITMTSSHNINKSITLESGTFIRHLWQHVTLTWNPSGVLRLYIDGQVDKELKIEPPQRVKKQRASQSADADIWDAFVIGRRIKSRDSRSDNEDFSGREFLIDELKYWSVEVEEGEIAEKGPAFCSLVTKKSQPPPAASSSLSPSTFNLKDLSHLESASSFKIIFISDIIEVSVTSLGHVLAGLKFDSSNVEVLSRDSLKSDQWHFIETVQLFIDEKLQETSNEIKHLSSKNINRNNFGTIKIQDQPKFAPPSDGGGRVPTRNNYGTFNGDRWRGLGGKTFVKSMRVCYGHREVLKKIGEVVASGKPQKLILDMDAIDSHNSLATNNDNFVATVTKETAIVPGKVDNALRLNVGQVVDVLPTINGSGEMCLINLQACKLGMYISMWLKFKETSSLSRYLIRNNDIEIYYKNDTDSKNVEYLTGRSRKSLMEVQSKFQNNSRRSKRDVVSKMNKLYSEFKFKNKKWSANVNSLPLDTWIFLEISWNPKSALEVHIDKILINKTYPIISQKKDSETLEPESKSLCFGCNKTSQQHSTTGSYGYSYKSEDTKLFLDEVELWFQDKQSLQDFDRITRDSDVYHIVVQFTEPSNTPTTSSTFFSPPSSSPSETSSTFYQITDNKIYLHPKLHGDAKLWKGIMIPSSGYGNLGSHNDLCFGNIKHCRHGFTISVFFKQIKYPQEDVFIISAPNYFVKLSKSPMNIVVGVKCAEKIWYAATSKDGILVNESNRVDVSWSEDRGLLVFVNKILKAKEFGGKNKDIYIGNATPLRRGSYHLGDPYLLIDQLDFWFASRNLIIGFHFMDDDISGFKLDMEKIEKDMIFHQSHTASVHNSPKVVAGYQGNGLLLNGLNQYLDLGRDVICKSDLDNCIRGITVKFKVKPFLLLDLTYFVASPLVEVYYERGNLICLVRNKTKQWTVMSPKFKLGSWNNIEITWHPLKGASLYINNTKVGQNSNPTTNEFDYQRSRRYLIGHADTSMKYEYYANAIFDDVEFWEGDKESLEKVGDFSKERSSGGDDAEDDEDISRLTDNKNQKKQQPTTSRSGKNLDKKQQNKSLQHFTSFPSGHSHLHQVPSQNPRYLGSHQQVYRPFHRRMLTFDGHSYIQYDLNYENLLKIYNIQNNDDKAVVDRNRGNYNNEDNYEEVAIKLKATDQNGLIYFSGSAKNHVYLCVKGGKLLLVVNYGELVPEKFKGHDDHHVKYDTQAWHEVTVTRVDRSIKINVDGLIHAVMLKNNTKLLKHGELYIGGHYKLEDIMNRQLRNNFRGSIDSLTYRNSIFMRKIDFIEAVFIKPSLDFLRVRGNAVMGMSPSREAANVNAITLFGNEFLRLPKWETKFIASDHIEVDKTVNNHNREFNKKQKNIILEPSGSKKVSNFQTIPFIELNFKTFVQDSLLLYSGGSPGYSDFLVLEISEGYLFAIYDSGLFRASRIKLGLNKVSVDSDEFRKENQSSIFVSDGAGHFVKIELVGAMMRLTLDNSSRSYTLLKKLNPFHHLGTFTYLGGVDNINRLPWHVWNREAIDNKFPFFHGCIWGVRLSGGKKTPKFNVTTPPMIQMAHHSTTNDEQNEYSSGISSQYDAIQDDEDYEMKRDDDTLQHEQNFSKNKKSSNEIENVSKNAIVTNVNNIGSSRSSSDTGSKSDNLYDEVGDFELPIDLYRLAINQGLTKALNGCEIVPSRCVHNKCNAGKCLDRTEDFECDCSKTSYSGSRCEKEAVKIALAGENFVYFRSSTTNSRHLSKISLRFKTTEKDGMIFKTKADRSDNFIETILKDGKLYVEAKFGEHMRLFRHSYRCLERSTNTTAKTEQTKLNDNNWHDVTLVKKADWLFVQIDRCLPDEAQLQGEGYSLEVDEIIIGGYKIPETPADATPPVTPPKPHSHQKVHATAQHHHAANQRTAKRRLDFRSHNTFGYFIGYIGSFVFDGQFLFDSFGVDSRIDINRQTSAFKLIEHNVKTVHSEKILPIKPITLMNYVLKIPSNVINESNDIFAISFLFRFSDKFPTTKQTLLFFSGNSSYFNDDNDDGDMESIWLMVKIENDKLALSSYDGNKLEVGVVAYWSFLFLRLINLFGDKMKFLAGIGEVV
ncbi:hypothetical protein HELRODRAFT_182201 [Helobdella robusta]|uniref:Laminin G domain-containing protein n=1 Tax=Helobdella robusta TaxID=6412 RepID=T1FHX2_HELRO|nr:hypothetical protein HELRODRAFT_182201 [Helobdella robusta]ESN91126.1 hypothetical protein HELRODRAFT_182201 [Helobdella robusta]